MLHTHSYAKINLFLNIVGKRSNAYHEIQSYFLRLKLADMVSLEHSKYMKCSVEGAEISGENIALKAAHWFKKICNTPKGVSIHIKKNIPVAAGLGGGSSNAAAVLSLLPKLWEVEGIQPSQFNEIALNIGADVPFFLNDHDSFAEGIGDKLTPINFGQKIYIILINPNIYILSKDAYEGSVTNIFAPKITCDEHSVANEIFYGKNDLEEYVKREYPAIKELLNSIKCQKNCLVSRMSGSGSTCFGIFVTKKDAARAIDNLSEIYPHFWTYAAF